MRYVTAAALLVLGLSMPAHGQFRNHVNLDRLNRRLDGCVVDYTHNHGADRRIYSPILGRPRDLYVYLPPGYSPSKAYPLIIYMHMAFVDEHTFVGSNRIVELDRMISAGEFPPAVVAVPDGLIDGENRIRGPHSLFVNGRFGRFADHLVQEVVPFVMTHYSIRPEREAHALLGVSAGGFGAASLALRHNELFGAVATIGAPLNLRYTTASGNSRKNFDPATFRWKTTYDPDEIVGAFTFGLQRVKASKYIAPVFGDDPADVTAKVSAVNPADLLFTTDAGPGRPAMYVNFAARDNWNFDAQAESFLWLAEGQGMSIDARRNPLARHNLPYFRLNHKRAYRWLACHVLPPADVGRR